MTRTSWIDLITGVGVVVSLMLVAVEIRGNTKAVRAAALQAVSDQSVELNLTLASVPELRSGYRKLLAGRHADLTLDEEDALTIWYAALMRLNENRYRQIQLGVFGGEVDRSGIAGVGGGTAIRLPFFRLFWQSRKSSYPADFRAFIDSVVLPLALDSVPRLIKR